jgi:predicted aspartyl protease
MNISLSPVPSLFAKVNGRNGTRELRAIVSPSSNYTVISLRDALQLGYSVIWRSPASSAIAITLGGIMRTAKLKLDEVSIGAGFMAKSVEALSYELPEPSGVDMILGKSFLKDFKLTFDYSKDTLCIEAV